MSMHVFISYCSSDRDYVERLAAYLVEAGLKVWYDYKLVVGDRWDQVVCHQIDTCSAVVVVMTPEAEASDWVVRELVYAQRVKRPILPLLLAGSSFFRLGEVHFTNVEGGRMPPRDFVSTLADLSTLALEVGEGGVGAGKANSTPNAATSGNLRSASSRSQEPKRRRAPSNRSTINPFDVPGWSPPRPLCPWRESWHRDYYVPTDSFDHAFDNFVHEMNDLTPLLHYGRVVLVTGERECGKSALVNRCVDWTLQRLDGGTTGHVVDLTSKLAGRSPHSVDDRMNLICDALVTELRYTNDFRQNALDDVWLDRDKADRIFPNLFRFMRDAAVLLILLPPAELISEVIRYASLASGRVLFLIESAYFNDQDVSSVVELTEQWAHLTTLEVGLLGPGDASRFVRDRLNRHAANGTYPQITEQALEELDNLFPTVGGLQRALYRVYEHFRYSEQYDDNTSVSIQDIVTYGIQRGAAP